MLEEIPENAHSKALDLQQVASEPAQQKTTMHEESPQTGTNQSSASTVRHTRDFSTSTNFTLETEGGASESDSLSPRGMDVPDDDDDHEEHEERTIWEHLRNPKVYGTILVIFLFLLIGVACGAHIFEAIVGAKQWFLDNPLISVPWYCFLFSVASAIFMPYGPFCISVGYIWGLKWGFPVQLCAIFVSSAFIYLVGRVLLKKWVNERTMKYRLWRAIMDHMGNDWREAAKINILMCFIPMPYGTHAYLFSLSECSFTCFVSVFEVGMIGHTFLNLAVGDALAMSAELGSESTSTLQFVATIVGVVAMILSIWYGGIVTQRIMEQHYNEDKMLVKNACTEADRATDIECGGVAQPGASSPCSDATVIELVLEGGCGEEEQAVASGSSGASGASTPLGVPCSDVRESPRREPTPLAEAVLAT
eukprot:CAMPEP_0202818440 /NCGR_PEP_ID=MMETSP1389-20130828/8339_1 /ASSEMBLY_ACC=CAM_ASM_000865 /TAXON_ID=302021 /ORGANISM="Rhodomonas sp., Strain CCMP768" /LENGTH=420 /DNA_ID=CAMNT_0049490795 /DNA_START=184 /DNA_END=1446 /DNA_ORIENTATION=-